MASLYVNAVEQCCMVQTVNSIDQRGCEESVLPKRQLFFEPLGVNSCLE